MKYKIEPKIWKDSADVIAIVVIISFIAVPFDEYLPDILKTILNHYTSTLGYLWLCYRAKSVEVKHIALVAGLVWIIKMVAYTLIFWNLIGTKYTVKGIVWGGFYSEAISAVVGSICYVTLRELRYYYKYYLKGPS